MSHALTPRHAAPPAASEPLPDTISRMLARADLRIAPHERSIAFVARLPTPFFVGAAGRIRLGAACLARGEAAAGLLRHALELALLLPRLPEAPVLAGLAAARVAAAFATIHGAADEPWHDVMAAAVPPPAAALRAVWARIRRLQAATEAVPDDVVADRLAACWALLGPAEALLQTGGDQRLRVDPATGLNGYGCSHRPRPWAVTFASSTASSSSERGFAAAEATRQRVTLAALTGEPIAALADAAGAVRAGIAAGLSLPAGSGVVLAASGTDCELLTLVLAGGRQTTSLLVAPEETGSGVPLAACFRHFGADTARGHAVVKGQPVDGFGGEVELATVAARGADGRLRAIKAIDAECAAVTAGAVAGGRRVIVHLLDISKTGYLAPSVAAADAIAARHGLAVQVVVDACQGRLTAARIAGYLGRGWIVLITGSKFLTAPPFAGAILLPPGLDASALAALPSGLAAYSSQPEWPPIAAAAMLPPIANYGLILRWQAALAELRALNAVGADRQHAILSQFGARLRQGIAANPDLALFDTAAPPRPDDAWDGLQTIIGFTVHRRGPDGMRDALGPDDARRVYHWLNADLRCGLPPVLGAEQERLACLRCHIGQPVPLAGGDDGRPLGVLRISAGARLVSGEPSHHDLDEEARLLREISDALSVLAKISLILAHWDSLCAADPRPSF